MSSRKSYKELKEDPLIGSPVLSWIMNRSVLYIGIGAIAAVAAGSIIIAGYQSLERMMDEEVEESDYLTIEAGKTPGIQWAQSFVNGFSNEDTWSVSEDYRPSHGHITEWLSSANELPATIIGTVSGRSTDGTRLTTQVYGAGQAITQYNRYKEAAEEASDFAESEIFEAQTFSTSSVRVALAGDSIIYFSTSSTNIDEVFENLVEDATTTLEETACHAIGVGENDPMRSPYYNAEEFRGLIVSTSVTTDVNLESLPNVVVPEVMNIAAPNMQRPEGPLPESFPNLPSDEQTQPTVGTAPEVGKTFRTTVQYRVPDLNGPGCGWDWSGQAPLQEDSAGLEAEKTKLIDDAQEDMDTQAQDYIDTVLHWSRQSITLSLEVETWNDFAEQTNKVHDHWQKLIDDRVAFQPVWDEYLRLHENWRTFPDRQSTAQEEYDDAVEACLAIREEQEEWDEENSDAVDQYFSDYEEWEQEEERKQQEYEEELEEWENLPEDERGDRPEEPEPTTPPTDPRDNRPNDCQMPDRPEIIDQERPSQPSEPEIPEDMTIPESWSRP